MLELVTASGEIDLKYLDESGFSPWSESGYTYYPRGWQKRVEETQRRGRRISTIGLFQPLISFIDGLVIGGVKRSSDIKIMEYYIKMMEQEALQPTETG